MLRKFRAAIDPAPLAKQVLRLARSTPELLLPHAKDIAKLIDSSDEPIRKSSLATLSLMSRISPKTVAFLIPRLHALLASEPQGVLANHAIEILTNYAKTSKRTADKVANVLTETIAASPARLERALKKLGKRDT